MSTRVFLDTNVLLDVLLERKPFCQPASQLWSLSEFGRIEGMVSVISFTNIYYIVEKLRSAKVARKALSLMRDSFRPVALDELIIHQAMDARMKDFEDAVQLHSALHAKCSHLVTRNPAHFKKAPIAVQSPEEFLAAFLPAGE